MSFLELSILVRREKGAQDRDAQIRPANPMLGDRIEVVYLLRTPRLIMLALAAEGRLDDRNAGTGPWRRTRDDTPDYWRVFL